MAIRSVNVEAPPPSQRASGVRRPIFCDALSQLLQHETAYAKLGRLTHSSPAYRNADEFCQEIIDSVLAARIAPAERQEFFRWAIQSRPRSKLLPVLATKDCLTHGDRDAAMLFAKGAVKANTHDLYAQKLHALASHNTNHSVELKGRFCLAPFEKIETSPNGEVYFCCPAWLPVPIGNLHSLSATEIWNSRAARDIRQSVLDGSYRYCSRMHCPKLTANQLPKNEEVTNKAHLSIIASGQVKMATGPIRVSLNHDRSCNLSCPSCRTKMILAKKPEQDRLIDLADRVIIPLLKHCRRVHISGSGEPFASGHFRYILKKISKENFPHLLIDLQTNGQLFDEKSWEELNLSDLVHSAYISIDAACEDTYNIVRRGGCFSRLMENLSFVAKMRRTGQIKRVRLDFVVQALNFREMPDVVDMVRAFGFDGVKFQMIRNWYTYTPSEFERHDIGVPEHPEFDEFLSVLADGRLREKFVEYWGFHTVRPSNPQNGRLRGAQGNPSPGPKADRLSPWSIRLYSEGGTSGRRR